MNGLKLVWLLPAATVILLNLILWQPRLTGQSNSIRDNYRNRINSSPDFKLLIEYGCITCHTTDGSKMMGPSFLELTNGKVTVINAKKKKVEVKIDKNYIRRSIIDPNAEIVEGYRKFSMPENKGKINKADLDKIVNLLTP